LEDVFDEIVKFSHKMSWGQKMNRKTDFAQKNSIKVVSKNTWKLLFYDFLKFWLLLNFSEENMNLKVLLMTPK
jgi:hypothetical protein